MLKDAVGPNGFLESATDTEAFVVDARELYHGKTHLVLRPTTTEDVSSVVKICAAAGISLTPQGGNTGYCGGATPDETGEQIILSLTRMNNIRHIDALNYTITVEAGCVLTTIQDAAEKAERLFLPNRWQPLYHRRWRRSAPLRQYKGSRTRARGRFTGWNCLERTAALT